MFIRMMVWLDGSVSVRLCIELKTTRGADNAIIDQRARRVNLVAGIGRCEGIRVEGKALVVVGLETHF